MNSAIATAETVKAAVLHLSENGHPVTADAVIKQIGGGPKTTVISLLREFMPQLGQVRSEAADIPAPVRTILNRVAVMLWNAAQEKARHGLEDLQKRYESFLTGQDEELSSVMAERDQLMQRNVGLETSLGELTDKHAETMQMLRSKEEELQLLTERHRLGESEHLKLRTRLERIEAEQGGDRKQLIELMTRLQTQLVGGTAAPAAEEPQR
jgi:hypothetical protein